MTIQDLGSVGELLAAVATIATLIYLAMQIRASAAATRAEARRTLDVSGYDLVRQIAGDPELTHLFMVGLGKPDALNTEQAFRFRLLMSFFFSSMDTAWKEVQIGTMSEEQLSVHLGRNRPMIEAPGGRAWWDQNSSIFPEQFREFLESQVPRLKREGVARTAEEPPSAAH